MCLVYVSLVRHKTGVCLHFLGQSPEHKGLLAPCVRTCRDQFAGYSSTQGIISVLSKNRLKIGRLWFTSLLHLVSTVPLKEPAGTLFSILPKQRLVGWHSFKTGLLQQKTRPGSLLRLPESRRIPNQQQPCPVWARTSVCPKKAFDSSAFTRTKAKTHLSPLLTRVSYSQACYFTPQKS